MKIRYPLLTIGMLVVAIHAVATYLRPEDVFFTRTANRFGFYIWRGQTKAGYSRVLNSWDIPPLTIETNGVPVGIRTKSEDDMKRVVIYNIQTRKRILEVRGYTYDDVEAAQKAMICNFSLMNTTRDYSTCTNDFGDRSYTYGSTGVTHYSAANFSRNNIFVRVVSETNTISAEAVARQIDADILRRSTEAAR